MLFFNLALSVLGPLGIGLLMEKLRFRNVFRGLMTQVQGSREEIAQQTKALITGSPTSEVTAGWLGLGAIFTGNFFLSTNTITFAAGAIMTLGLGLNRMMRQRKRLIEKGQVDAAREAMLDMLNNGPSGLVEGMARGMYLTEAEPLQTHAVQAMAAWASTNALSFLEEAKESEYYEVQFLAAREHEKLAKVLQASEPGRIEQLLGLIQAGQYWERLGKAFQQGPMPRLLNGPEAPTGEEDPLHKAFRFQSELVKAYPAVFCMVCRTRGEKLSVEGWSYVQCKTCKEAENLLAGVQTVVGRVGPLLAPVLDGGVLPLSLWNMAEAAPTPAEVDRVEVAAGADFNYDWAVSGAIEGLRNRFPDSEAKWEIHLDPGLELGQNTRNLILSISNGKGSGLY